MNPLKPPISSMATRVIRWLRAKWTALLKIRAGRGPGGADPVFHGLPEPGSPAGPSWMGCLFPVAAVVVLLGLGTCTAVTGWRMDRAIAGFTEGEARPYGREAPAVRDGEVQRLRAKLETLREAAREGRRVEVPFSVVEMNHLMRTERLLESLRESTRVVRVGTDGMEVESSQPLRQLGGGLRYLNGTFLFRPVESGTNSWQLELRSVRVPGKEVPEGFVEMARELRLFRFDLDAGGLQEVLRQVERMELEEGRVLVVTRAERASATGKR